MQGALQPISGHVLVDDVDVSKFSPASVRAQIAHLPQSGTLFHGSIMENLTMFRPELEERALDIAETLGLDDVVSTMPLGYNTVVGSGACDSLPRGIRQRIVIARGLLDNPQYVLFDEANTAVDGTGDVLLRQWLERAKGRHTLVLVTHRPSLLNLADRVFNIENGELIPRPPAPPAVPQAGGARV
jgi:ATP-binding cassette subfamily C protein LapB